MAARSADGGSHTARRAALLRGFDRVARRALPHLSRQGGDVTASRVVADARREFERIIPQLPDIGGRANCFSPVIVANGWLIAFLRAMESRGRTVQDVIRVACAVTDEFFRSFPRFALRLIGRVAFTWPVRRLLERQATRSQARRHPEDFVYTAGGSPGGEWTLEFTECAVHKLYEAQGVERLGPYCNFFDVTYSRLMGMGLDARETIGLGCPTCRLRFRSGRETEIPERLRGLLPGT